MGIWVLGLGGISFGDRGSEGACCEEGSDGEDIAETHFD